MSDIEQFKAMLTRVKVVFNEGTDPETNEPNVEIKAEPLTGEETPNNKGYFGFETIFTFTREGALKDVGVWE